jgi:glycosyltransferase involved in cell wall biosynthesis
MDTLRSETSDRSSDRRLRVLAVCDRWPWPVRSGGQHRLAAMLEALSALGELDVVVVAHDAADDAARAATAAELPGARIVAVAPFERPARRLPPPWSRRWPWWKPWGTFDVPRTAAAVRHAVGRDCFDIVWSYSTFGALLHEGWGAPVRVLDLPEVMTLMTHRQHAVEPAVRGARGCYSRYLQWVRMNGWRRVERRACTAATLVTICTATDREWLPEQARVNVVPNGYSIPESSVGHPDVGDPPTLLFQGTMSHLPNADGAVFFAREVLPLIRRSVPDAVFRIVGRPGVQLTVLAEVPGVAIAGEVPDISDELATADLVVVPLRIGSGTRLKILEAWAHEVPVVSTTIGAEGLGRRGIDTMLVADTGPELAAACVRVLTEPKLRRELSACGRREVETGYSWTVIQSELRAVLRAAGEHRP